MKFAIRDDDICFHTDPILLKQTYSPILDQCPVSFSCIPFVGGFDVETYDEKQWGLYDEQWIKWQTKEIHPLEKNEPLCDLLRNWVKEQKVSILLHGIHHDLYEFCKKTSLKKEIQEGKTYLEKTLKAKVSAVSPPNNSLSRQVSKDLDELGLNMLIAFGHTPNERPLDFYNLKNFMHYMNLYAAHKKKYRLHYPLRFKNHFEMPCYTLGPNSSVDELFEGLKITAKKDGCFVLATHYYHLFDHSWMQEKILELIAYAKKITNNQVKFVKAEELFI